MAQMGFKAKVNILQTKIKAPKNLYNKFGNYSYRNAEGILEAVKPYLEELKLLLKVEDEISLIGDRYYVKATATLIDTESEGELSNVAYAREDNDKKGMDSSQLTGSTSSYARKYALNGLFLLDDTKDADTDEYHEETTKKANKVEKLPKANADQIGKLKTYALQLNVPVDALLKEVGRNDISEITDQEFSHLMNKLKSTEEYRKKENK